jgi:Xaa-Pro dipeptidase
LSDLFNEMGIASDTVGILDLFMPTTFYFALENALPRAEIVSGYDVWVDYLNTPSEYDKDMIHKTAAIADEYIATVKTEMKSGVTEREVALETLDRVGEMGAEFFHHNANHTHAPNFGSGSHVISNVRSYLFTNRRFEHGEMFWMDGNVQYNGYYMDFDRTFCIGEPTEEQEELYGVVRDMWDAMLETIEPGVESGTVWDVGYEIAEEAGYGDFVNWIYFGHGTGPQIGYPPMAGPGHTKEFEADTFFNIEPGIMLPGGDSACIESCLHITEDGAEPILDWPIDIQVV